MSATSVARYRFSRATLIGRAALLLISGVLAYGCSSNTSTTPTATPPAAGATIRERYTSTLPVGGSKFFSFSIATAGNVVATLESIGGAGVPASVVVNLGIGSPFQTGCSANLSAVQLSGDAGLSSVVSATKQPGVVCVVISDAGNLSGPATFTVVIDHP